MAIFQTSSYSLVQGGCPAGATCSNLLTEDSRFVDTTGGSLRLQLTSPAIDAGNNAAVPSDVTTDLDGNPRFVDIPSVPDTGNGTPPIVDMGAYEAHINVAIGGAFVPPFVAPGRTITFSLTLYNTGSLPAAGIVVTNTLPAILTGLSFTSTLSVTDTGHVPPYVWTVQDPAAGQGGVSSPSAAS